MEIQINNELVTTERRKRAWSQSQLADIAGLSLRTIQRIEKTGTASLESTKSIAAAIEIRVEGLQLNDPLKAENKNYPIKNTTIALDKGAKTSLLYKITVPLCILLCTITGLLFIPASAQSMLIDLSLSSDKIQQADVQLISVVNSESSVIINNELRIQVTTFINQEGRILLKTKVYDVAGEAEQLLAAPETTTGNQQTAEIKFDHYTLSLTPSL